MNTLNGWTSAKLNRNKNLIKKYPWLEIKNLNGSNSGSEDNVHRYDYTWLDDMPTGWRVAFGLDMCEEIQKELERINYVDKYEIIQVKEKYGGLRWYTGPIPANSKLDKIAHKYERKSENICIECGKPAKWITTGWISPYCDDCIKQFNKEYIIPIKES